VDVFSNSCPHPLAKAERFSEEFKNNIFNKENLPKLEEAARKAV